MLLETAETFPFEIQKFQVLFLENIINRNPDLFFDNQYIHNTCVN